MSDLLPLVATVLRDKAALDAQNEIKELKNRLEIAEAATRLEIIYDAENTDDESFNTEPFVCASVPFANGSFDRRKLTWDIPFDSTATYSIKLSHLRQVSICVGGGFPILNMDDASMKLFGTQLQFTNTDEETPQIHLSAYDMQLSFALVGCDRSVWEPWTQLQPPMPLHLFFDTFCLNCADANAMFLRVRFNAASIRGPLQRLLPPESRSAVVAKMTRKGKSRKGNKSMYQSIFCRLFKRTGKRRLP